LDLYRNVTDPQHWILFNADMDPDPAFNLNAGPDTGNQNNADKDPGHVLLGHKNFNAGPCGSGSTTLIT
jgi:hypothetical protein